MLHPLGFPIWWALVSVFGHWAVSTETTFVNLGPRFIPRTVCCCFGRLRMQVSAAAWVDGSEHSCAPIYVWLWTRTLMCSHQPLLVVDQNTHVFPLTFVLLYFGVPVVASPCSRCMLASCFHASAYMFFVTGSVHGGVGLIIVRASAILAQGLRKLFPKPHPPTSLFWAV